MTIIDTKDIKNNKQTIIKQKRYNNKGWERIRGTKEEHKKRT